MRINIYSQELTKEIELVSKVAADTRITYYGIRLYLASPDILHHTAEDDDRSAITFWIPNAQSFTKADLVRVFDQMGSLAANAPNSEPNDGTPTHEHDFTEWSYAQSPTGRRACKTCGFIDRD